MIQALIKELLLRKDELKGEEVETIYFGGGTPSLLAIDELKLLIDTVYKNYKVTDNPEITLEANPDDLSEGQIHKLANTKINRLSIGIQSFFDEDLKLMNRAHSSKEARESLSVATHHFDNISIDLIYGIPGLSNERWLRNIETALSFNVPHISSYALTIEPKTALEVFIKKGIIKPIDDELAQQQFFLLIDKLEAKEFVHYEISNFGKKNYFSINNSAYWQGKSYLGIGPSAHSFNGKQRSWNVANNAKYIKSIQQNILPIGIEKLSLKDRYNEYVMTGLRTIWGISLHEIEQKFGLETIDHLLKGSEKFINQGLLEIVTAGDCDSNRIKKLKITKKGKFLADGIASDLFILN